MKVGEPGNELRIRVFQVKTKKKPGVGIFVFFKDFSDFSDFSGFSHFLLILLHLLRDFLSKCSNIS